VGAQLNDPAAAGLGPAGRRLAGGAHHDPGPVGAEQVVRELERDAARVGVLASSGAPGGTSSTWASSTDAMTTSIRSTASPGRMPKCSSRSS